MNRWIARLLRRPQQPRTLHISVVDGVVRVNGQLARDQSEYARYRSLTPEEFNGVRKTGGVPNPRTNPAAYAAFIQRTAVSPPPPPDDQTS